jgi:hypothetical protein
MSNVTERSQGSDPLQALYASRRPRPEPRLASVNEAPVARAPRPDAARPNAPLTARNQGAFPESMPDGSEPEFAADPDDFKSEGLQRKVFAGVIGVAAALAVASIVALLLVNIFPKDRDADQSFAGAVPARAGQAHQVSDSAKPSAAVKTNETTKGDAAQASHSQPSAPPSASDRSTNLDHEQSERLLQQFMQWRQKAAPADKP